MADIFASRKGIYGYHYFFSIVNGKNVVEDKIFSLAILISKPVSCFVSVVFVILVFTSNCKFSRFPEKFFL